MPRIAVTLPADGDDAIVEPYNAAILLIQGVLDGAVDADNLAAGAVTLAALSSTLQAALVPTGLISPYGGTSAPTGYLMCDGGSYLRASFSPLFAVIGTAYGTADGTHFNVPDFRGRVAVGNDSMTGNAANATQRTSTITTTNASTAATVGSSSSLSEGMIIKSTNVPVGTTIISITGTAIVMSANASATGSAVAARFSMLSDAAALGGVGGFDVATISINQLAAHTHGVPATGTTGSGGNAYQLDTFAPLTAQPTQSTGGSQPHSAMQPSIVTNYLIKI